jgi:hypothetical protein
METRIEAVLFDWGRVLIENPAPGLMAYCAKALRVGGAGLAIVVIRAHYLLACSGMAGTP